MRMLTGSSFSRIALRAGIVGFVLAAAACSETVPTSPDLALLRVESRIECVGNTQTRAVSCTQPAVASVSQTDPVSKARIEVPAAMRDVILGNQGGYVKLASSNIVVGGGVFAFDVTVQNKIVQSIGTTDGSTVDPTGIRVFFNSGPTVNSGTGVMDFDDGSGGCYCDGRFMFTASNQPFFKYSALLKKDSVSTAKTWRLRFDPGVLTFSFTLYVSAPVQFPNGYVSGNPNVLTLNYGQTSPAMTPSVRSAVNNVISGTVAYTSDSALVASVDAGTGAVTAGSTRGITYINLSAASGTIPNYISTAVNVCASTPTVSSGAVINGDIDVNDCYSGFATAQGRPDSTYRSDMYRISLTAGQNVDITMSAGAFIPWIGLVDPIGVVEAFTNSGHVSHFAQRSGTYIIEAGQDDPFALTNPGPYTLSVTTTP
jgi:hypothetical protein